MGFHQPEGCPQASLCAGACECARAHHSCSCLHSLDTRAELSSGIVRIREVSNSSTPSTWCSRCRGSIFVGFQQERVLGFSESLACTYRCFRQVSLLGRSVSLLHYPGHHAKLPTDDGHSGRRTHRSAVSARSERAGQLLKLPLTQSLLRTHTHLGPGSGRLTRKRVSCHAQATTE